MSGEQQRIPVNPEVPLSVTMPARMWEDLVNILASSDGSFRVIAAVINAVNTQCTQQAMQAMETK